MFKNKNEFLRALPACCLVLSAAQAGPAAAGDLEDLLSGTRSSATDTVAQTVDAVADEENDAGKDTEVLIVDKDLPEQPASEALSMPDPQQEETDPDYIETVPPGFHRMPGGAVMANNPAKAVAPPGYRLTSAGILVRDTEPVTADEGHGGMLMAEYRFERMYMSGFLDTTTEVSPQQVISDYGYTMTGTDMTMDMHMLMLMYHTRSYMVMLMGHYMSNTMGMLSSDGTRSTMQSSGIADTVLTLTVPWLLGLDYTLGVSIPTGSIDEHGLMQHTATFSSDEKYPYGMQLGSGTWDWLFGVGYENDEETGLNWGLRYQYLLRTGTNKNGYTLGDKSMLDGWVGTHFTSTITGRVGLDFLETGQIDGSDPEMNAAMSPAADAGNYGGRRLDLGVRLRYETPLMTSIALDYRQSVYQNLWGPQMKNDWIAAVSLGYMF